GSPAATSTRVVRPLTRVGRGGRAVERFLRTVLADRTAARDDEGLARAYGAAADGDPDGQQLRQPRTLDLSRWSRAHGSRPVRARLSGRSNRQLARRRPGRGYPKLWRQESLSQRQHSSVRRLPDGRADHAVRRWRAASDRVHPDRSAELGGRLGRAQDLRPPAQSRSPRVAVRPRSEPGHARHARGLRRVRYRVAIRRLPAETDNAVVARPETALGRRSRRGTL